MLDCLDPDESIEVSELKWSGDSRSGRHAPEPLALCKLTVYEFYTRRRMLDAINRCLGRHLEEVVDQKARTTAVVQYSARQRSPRQNVRSERLNNRLTP